MAYFACLSAGQMHNLITRLKRSNVSIGGARSPTGLVNSYRLAPIVTKGSGIRSSETRDTMWHHVARHHGSKVDLSGHESADNFELNLCTIFSIPPYNRLISSYDSKHTKKKHR